MASNNNKRSLKKEDPSKNIFLELSQGSIKDILMLKVNSKQLCQLQF
jgi:hypothetical protein